MRWTRTFFIYGVLWLTVIVMVKLSYLVLASWLFMEAQESLPNFRQQVESLQKTHATDREAQAKALFEAMQPVIDREDWVSIRLLLSLVVFAPVGFLAGRLSGDPRWAGGLPVLALIPPDPSNPALLQDFPGVQAPELNLLIALLAVQLISVYLFAWGGAVIYWRKKRVHREEDTFR